MNKSSPALIFLFIPFIISCSTPTRPQTTLTLGQQTRIFPSLNSVKALRDQAVVKQKTDYSCGASALATLLSYGLGDSVTEAQILQQLLTVLPHDQKQLREKQGFSLLDLQMVAKQRGYKAMGFYLRPENLVKLHSPVIVFIKPHGYNHFAVLKGVRHDRVYLADPALGNIRMPAYQFLTIWQNEKGKGIIFVVEKNKGVANNQLRLPSSDLVQPELLGTRQLLETGIPSLTITPFR